MSKPNLSEPYSNKLYETLGYFHPSEWKRLQRFVDAPYFNVSPTLSRLCHLLIAQLEKGKSGFSRVEIWIKLFDDNPYDDVNFRKYCSDLLALVERFMAHERLSNRPEEEALQTLAFIAERKIEPRYNAALRLARSRLDAMPFRSSAYYFAKYELERHYFSMMDYDVKVNVETNLEAISGNLDVFFLIEKLQLYCSVLSQKRTATFNYEIALIQEVIRHLETYPLESHPELAIYYYFYRILREEEELEHYFKLRALIEQFGNVIPKREAQEIYDAALNYCTGKVNKGGREFLQDYFDLFNEAMRRQIFIQNGELAQWRFNNIIGAALRLGKLDWAEKFVENHKDYLNPTTRENTYTFNLARVYRYQKKYHKVLTLLQSVEYEDIIYNFISKAMLIISYYELDELDALDSFLESFRVFLNRNKNAPYRTNHLNLIKYMRRILRIMPGDKAGVAQIRADLERDKEVTVNYEWLVQKLEELE
ncbi:MAG: hypothetical protein J0L99_16195 [Chitinophagales bacterium]|nr:hypothetical protein [Chitinophagales bacterium]